MSTTANLPAIPDPQTQTLTIAAAIDAGAAVAAWAGECEDMVAVHEVYNRWDVFAEYLAQNDAERVGQAVKLLLKRRMGELLGPAVMGRPTAGSSGTPELNKNELHEFGKLAAHPVVAEASSQPDPEAAILDLKVIDPACGSGHFLIAAAHRIAKRLAAIRTGDDEPSPDATRTALRDVIGRCIHGIDLNPMAVELCKVSLWMESMEPGKPLGFLDHRIVRGNALIGATPELLDAGIPDDAFKPLTGDDKAYVASLKKRNKKARGGQSSLFGGDTGVTLAPLAAKAGEVDAIDDDTVAAVQAKATRWSELVASPEYQAAVHAADTWCATFAAPKNKTSLDITHAE